MRLPSTRALLLLTFVVAVIAFAAYLLQSPGLIALANLTLIAMFVLTSIVIILRWPTRTSAG